MVPPGQTSIMMVTKDLFETSGDYFNLFYINDSSKLDDRANIYGLEDCPASNNPCPVMRASTPLWLDWNQDGLLDLIIANTTNNDQPTKLYRRAGSHFEDASNQAMFEVTTPAAFAQIGDITGNDSMDILVHAGTYPNKIYSVATIPFTEITSLLPKNSNVMDAIIADFSGDLKNDIFLAIGKTTSDIYQPAVNQINVRTSVNKEEKGITFKATGKVTFDLEPFWTPTYIGSSGYRVPSTSLRSGLPDITLSPDDPQNFGLKEHIPGSSNGIYIGYDPVTKLWTIVVSSGSSGAWLGATIMAEGAISEVTPIGITPFVVNTTNLMLVNSADGFTKVTDQAGLGIKANCYSAAAGDLDNDMDMDLYVSCGRPAGNTAHFLYANRGDGVFDLVSLSGGALASPLGSVDSVTVADYDMDGFLDLFVVNSDRRMLTFHGPHQLFHNTGNINHWIEIDLEGVVSNRDGIGARLFLTTPDGKVQLREQNGGMHRISQNHQRIHFGLGPNTKVAKLEIRWPNGIVQTVQDIVANQLIRMIEPSLPSPKDKPAYTVGGDARVFVWRETFDGPYHLRANGGGQDTQYAVKLLSDQPLVEAKSVGDVSPWTQTTHGFNLNANLNNTEVGADFRLQSGSRGLLAVNKDSVANPRQLGVGATAKPLSPAGWVLPAGSLATRPDYVLGVDAGLFIGAGTAANSLEARWTGNGPHRKAAFDLLASRPFKKKMQPFSLEQDDKQFQTANSLSVDGWVAAAHDGANFILESDSDVGIAYRQDELFAYRRVNAKSGGLSMPNAYWLPRAEPYGKPVYDTGKEKGLFVWKDKGGLWHVRGTGGGGTTWKISGRFVSDQPATAVTSLSMEFGSGGDLLNSADSGRIDFRMQLTGNGWDGFDFNLPPGATLKLELDIPEQSDRVRIGAEKWPISMAPLELSGW